LKNNISKEWDDHYKKLTNKNIGLFSTQDQELIRTSKVVVFGTGGLGGPLSEQLVRSGCEHLTICDNDVFELTNLNRQLCTIDDMGKKKVNVLKRHFKKINPRINLSKFGTVSEKNILEIIEKSSVAVLALDDLITSIGIARECAKQRIPLIESWGTPFLWSWWFTPESMDFESSWGFETMNMTLMQIKKSKKILYHLKESLMKRMLAFPNILEKYDREKGYSNMMLSGERPIGSIAPIIRLNASLLAFEVIYAGILRIKEKCLAPTIRGYDYFKMESFKIHLS